MMLKIVVNFDQDKNNFKLIEFYFIQIKFVINFNGSKIICEYCRKNIEDCDWD